MDNNIISDKHEGVRFEDFWQSFTKVDCFRSQDRFVLEISSLPPSTAAVERTFSKLNLNKTKIRNRFSVNTLEAIIKLTEIFPNNFDVNPRLHHPNDTARKIYMKKYSLSRNVMKKQPRMKKSMEATEDNVFHR